MAGERVAVLNMQDDRPAWALPDWAVAEIRAALGPGWRLIHVREPVSGRGDGGGAGPEALQAARGAEIIMALGLPREMLRSALEPPRALRWIHSGSAGVRSLLHPELVEADEVVLTNSAGVHAPPMAEAVIGMVLHFARGFDYAVRSQARGEWDKGPFERVPTTVREIRGATLGILGLGGIGREVGWRATALGMNVIATRRRPDAEEPAGIQLLRGEDALDELLQRSDYLVIAVPSTRHTRNLIAAPELARMPDGAVLINVARGEVVDAEALLEALRTHRLRGAALDVFPHEPLPPHSPFWSQANVLVTPHVSATTPAFWRREVDLIVENIHRYLEGQPLRNQVDRDAGY